MIDAASRRGALKTADYTHPTLECDIVMKGGITSGVVYPLAVCGLAKEYRLRNVGGASAGAIAAAAAAAAEYGREKGGFNGLADLPDDLSGTLSTLFQGSKQTDPLLRVLKRAVATGSWKRKALPVAATAIRARLLWATSGFVLSALIVMGLWALGGGDNGRPVARWVLVLLGAVLGAVIGATVGLVRTLLVHVPRNGYGICSGMSSSGYAPLTEWLSAKLDSLAGLQEGEGPLTFGHLWGSKATDEYRLHGDVNSPRDLNLEVMTTNLTFRLPQRVPFTAEYLFCPVQVAALLPPYVVDQMVATSEEWENPNNHGETFDCPCGGDHKIRCLPPAPDLPVVLAARLSLSFPVLLSAFPLFAVDRSRKEVKDWLPVQCWFSDGGISSNFPIHFFDALFPTRPTFGINLDQYHPDYPDMEVFYPGAGKALHPQARDVGSLLGFLQSILDTMQNWSDRAQSSLAGYRERVVHVHYGKGEGGMNLMMPPEIIDVLANRGALAAERFAEFDADQHRWTRYRTTMAELEQAFARLHEGNGPSSLATTIESLIRTYGATAPFYALEDGPRDAAGRKTHALLVLLDGWFQGRTRFEAGSPRPDPDLRITPHF